MDLSAMVNKIHSYNSVLAAAGYAHTGDGVKAWSRRYTHHDGTAIDIRNSDWTLYSANGVELAVGKDAESLQADLAKKPSAM